MTKFTDVKYMTARDKELLLKAWTTFVRNGLKREHFTRRIYEHLSLHVGHIAHFDIHGFYAVWLDNGTDRVEFMRHFLEHRILDDYADVHNAMCEVLREHVEPLREQARVDEIERLSAERNILDHKLSILLAAERV